MGYGWPKIVRTIRGAGLPRDRCVVKAEVTRLPSALQCVTLLTSIELPRHRVSNPSHE